MSKNDELNNKAEADNRNNKIDNEIDNKAEFKEDEINKIEKVDNEK
ncbi:13484_t:CDS:2 [Dentiscutata heterogama]|uniref:13484_t:CDS:1 n=1 Tax=Dentiscutata heterogama TaxID=1316150 RepID=A0ACA9L1M7_9GLOM|nr:13484_t:CDS:2 [Dentiscutata heterogama]